MEKQDGRYVALVTKDLQTLNLKFDQAPPSTDTRPEDASQTKRQKKYDWRGGAINQGASPAASLPPRHCSPFGTPPCQFVKVPLQIFSC